MRAQQFHDAFLSGQVQRADGLQRELADVVKQFDAWTAKELPGINDALAAKKQPKVEVLTRQQWEAAGDEGGAGGARSLEAEEERGLFERD